MSRKFLTRLLAVVMSAGLFLQPVAAYAVEPVEEVVAEELGEGEKLAVADAEVSGNQEDTALEETEEKSELEATGVEIAEPGEENDLEAETVKEKKISIAGEIVDDVATLEMPNEASTMEGIPLPKKMADSGIAASNIEEIVIKGNETLAPTFEAAKGDKTAVEFVKWEYYNDGDYEEYIDDTFGSGQYRAVVKVTIDSFWINGYKFGPMFNYSVDGYTCDLIDKTTDETGEITAYYFGTRPINTGKVPLPSLKNVYIDGDYLYWDSLEGATIYRVEIANNYWDYKSSPANIHECFECLYSECVLKEGTFPVKLSALNEAEEKVSLSYTISYTFVRSGGIIFDKIVISSVNLTSDIKDMLVVGGPIKTPTYTVVDEESPVQVDAMYWYHGEKGDYTGFTFERGTYNTNLFLYLTGNDRNLYKFNENLTLFVDGQEWDMVSYSESEERCGFYFGSPDFVVGEEVLPEPEPIPVPKPDGLPALTNVRIDDDDYLRFDSFTEDCLYNIEFDNFVFQIYCSELWLPAYFGEKYASAGEYTIYVTALNYKFEQISETAEVKYYYDGEGPITKTIYIHRDSVTSNIDSLVNYGDECVSPTFTSQNSWLIYAFEGWQEYYVNNDDPDNPEEGWRRCKAFNGGKYRAVVAVGVGNDYIHELDGNFILSVNGEAWHFLDYCITEEAGMVFMFVSPTYEVVDPNAPEDPEDPDEPEDPEDPDEPEDPDKPEKHMGTWKNKYGAIYYETEEGEILSGIQEIDGDTYLFSEKGTLQSNVFHEENGKTFYFGKDGKMVKGFMDKWGASYYFNEAGEMQTGFVDIEGDTYYFKADGRQTKSTWITVGSDKFYTKADGKLAKAETMTKWGKKYTFNEAGVLMP